MTVSTTTYYKATRPDGTSRNGVQWRVGEVTRHPSPTRMVRDDPRTYLSLSVEPAETLIGGSVPARLFEVEPLGDVETSSRHTHKRCVLAARVVRELPGHVALGPNGREVAALIDRVRRMTSDEMVQVGAAWDAAWDAAWGAARDAAWGAARDAAWGAARDAAWGAARDAAWGAAWDAAWDAARVAALALVVRDLVTPEQFDALAGPLLSVVGPVEEMPVPEWCERGGRR